MKRIPIVILTFLVSLAVSAADFTEGGFAYTIVDKTQKEVNVAYGPQLTFAGDIVIPATVTHDGQTYSVVGTDMMAFYSQTKITNVTFGANMRYVGDNAFYGCLGLQKIDIPDNITKLGEGAFIYCTGVTEVHIGNGLTEIAPYAFNSLTLLESLVIPDNIVKIGKAALAYQESLKDLTIGPNVESIGEKCFFDTQIERLNMLCLTPPTVAEDAFPDAYFDECTVTVPHGALDVYAKAPIWSKFKNVEEGAVADATFAEGFEGWDGETNDWLPDGWQDISQSGHKAPAEGMNFTWYVTSQNWGDEPQEGKYYARVNNAYYSGGPSTLIVEPQDEWMITPVLTNLPEKQKLTFKLGFHPSRVLFNEDEKEFTSINNVLEVWALPENLTDDKLETQGTFLWDCLAAARSFSREELIKDLQSLGCQWWPAEVSLWDYAGKNVRLGFRYVGIRGESMNVDDVLVFKGTAIQPEPKQDKDTVIVHYAIPEGCFYYGDNGDRYILPGGVIMPAHTELTWKNDSQVPEGTTFSWHYTDPEKYNMSYVNFSYLDVDAQDLTYKTGSFNFSVLPTLTARTPIGNFSFTRTTSESQGGKGPGYWQSGGAPGESYYGNVPGQTYKNSFGFSAYDQNLGTAVYYGDMAYTSFMMGTGPAIEHAGATGLATIFHRPAAPYQIDHGLMANMYFELADDALITVKLRKATKVSDDVYTLGEEIAHGSFTGKMLNEWGNLLEGSTKRWGRFACQTLYRTVNGEEVEVTPLIDGAIAVVFEGWDSDKVKTFALMTNGTDENVETCAMWTGGKLGNTARAYNEHYAASVTLMAHFPYLYTEENVRDLGGNGGVITFDIDQYQYLNEFTVAEKPEWVRCGNKKDATLRRFNNSFTVEYDPNASDEARTGVIVLTDTDGSRLEITLNQAPRVGDDVIVNVGGLNYVLYEDQTCAVTKSTVSGSLNVPKEVAFNGVTYRVTGLLNRAFERQFDLKSVVLPEGMEEIGDSVFYGCTGLESVVWPSTIQRSGAYAFYGCGALARVDISDLTAWCVVDFDGARANPLPWAKHLFLNGEELTNLTFPKEQSDVKPFTFYNCLSLKQVVIPNHVKSVGASAFCYCENVENVYVGSGVTEIGGTAFYATSALKTVTSAATVPPVCGNSAFYSPGHKTSDVTLYVPVGTAGLYANAIEWKEFTIVERDPEGIEGVMMKNGEPEIYYDLQGRRIYDNVKGNVRISKDGRKVF